MIEEIVADHLDALERAGQPADLIRHFAAPIPSLVGCLLFDIPRDDHAELARNLDISRTDVRSREQRMAAGKAYMAYMTKFTARKRRRPGDDLLSALIREHGTDMTDEELTGTVATLLAPSVLNVGGTLGLAVLALLRHPEQGDLLRARPDLIDRAVEELTRYATVVATASPAPPWRTYRSRDRSSRPVTPSSAHCSRPTAPSARGAPPDDLDITRADTNHMAYGHGIHHCLGAPLARMTLRIALPALLDRFPGLRLAVPPEDLRYKAPTGIYGVESLPVTW
ncbi:Cytochrome P450 OS=Streptomyces alboniger OX=132473 GN=CP975_32045 PE=3 SV=1 [Streptomyces alboniger]